MDWLGPNPNQAVIDNLNARCLDEGAFSQYDDTGSFGVLLNGSGKMKSTDNTAGYTCYEFNYEVADTPGY